MCNDKDINKFSDTITLFEHVFKTIVNSARRKVVYSDRFFSPEHLQLFTEKLPWVLVQIVTTHDCSITQEDINSFNKECGHLEVVYKLPPLGRYLVIDDTYCYLVGVDKEYNVGYLSPIRQEATIALYANTTGF